MHSLNNALGQMLRLGFASALLVFSTGPWAAALNEVSATRAETAGDPYFLDETTWFGWKNWPAWHDTDGLEPVDSRLIAGESTAVIIALGQSNVANYAQGDFTPVNAKVEVLSVYGGLYRVGSGPLPGAGGNMDNFLKRLADKRISEGKNARVILVPIAISSTSFADWAAGGAMNDRIKVAARRIAAAGFTATHVIIGMGETDSVAGTSLATCVSQLRSIITTLQATSMGNTPIYISSESYWKGTVSDRVTTAQAAVVGGTVFAGPNADSLGPKYRYDDVHWNAVGADAIADLWNKTLR